MKKIKKINRVKMKCLNFLKVSLLTVICFSLPQLNAFAQTKTVSGNVTDKQTQEFLPGVTVVVQGTTNGTITDIDGNYQITNVPDNGTLVFSFIGMKTQKILVTGKTTVNIIMETDAIGIEEVIAIGYGTMKKADITGAVANVKGETLAASGTFSAAAAMQGKMAGVQVINNGDAGADSKIRIRGVNTIGNNNPLVVIDGITTGASLQEINSADIESIDVLKDASSLAIFGSRASNGVIMVTTKKGNYGKNKISISLDASYGIAKVPNRFDLVSASQLVDIIDEARLTENNQLGGNYQLYDEIWPNDNWARQDLTEWQEEVFQTGTTQNYSLSINGGSDNTIFGFGASYRDQKGTMVRNFAKRKTARANFESKVLNDNLKIGGSFNYSQIESRGSVQGFLWSSNIFRASQTPPSTPAYFPDGTPYQELDGAKIAYIHPGDKLENWVVNSQDYSNPNDKVLGNLYADWEIIDGLDLKTSYGFAYKQNFSRAYGVKSLNPRGDDASLNVKSNRSFSYSWDNTLTYNKIIGVHKINVMAGINAYRVQTNGLNAYRQIFPEGDPEELRYMDFGSAETQTNGESASEVSLFSYFGRLNYSYADKYLLTATFRRDGSSRFHRDVRWGTFPSFSLGWRISEEGFMSDVDWLDMLKLRASWGQVGNQAVGSSYAYISTVQSGVESNKDSGKTDYIFGADQHRATGKVIVKRGNENLTWETTTMTNFGLDYAVGKFGGSLEYFYNKTDNILLDSQFPDVAGYTFGTSAVTPKVNAGQVDTKGVDFNVDFVDQKGDFNYSVGFNFTYLKNEIVILGDREFILGTTTNYHNTGVSMSRAYVGDPIGSFYGWQLAGIFNSPEEVEAANINAREKAKAANPDLSDDDLAGIYYISANTASGDYMFKDNNGDGIITDEDKAYLGCGNPKFNYGLNFNVSYKGFDAALNLTGVSGVQLQALFEPPLSNPAGGTNLASTLDHWTPDNNKTDNFPRYTMSDPNNNLRPSDRWIYEGSYTRIQNLVFGYSLPTPLVQRAGLANVRFYMNIQNLYTFTSYPFLDPEVKGSNQDGGTYDTSAGLDAGSSPLPRTFVFGINLKF